MAEEEDNPKTADGVTVKLGMVVWINAFDGKAPYTRTVGGIYPKRIMYSPNEQTTGEVGARLCCVFRDASAAARAVPPAWR